MSDTKRTDEIQGEIIHEYDGIEEADNRLPNWWLATFYGAIVFAFVYWFALHEYDSVMTPTEAYAAELADQGEGDVASEADLLALADDASAVADGQEVFSTTCAACHGDAAQGVIGPNLTDEHWLHGGSATAIYASVRDGITADQALIEGSAGMPGWAGQLGEGRVRNAVAYILSIRNTNVEGGREPEGEVYAEGGDDAEAALGEAAPDDVDAEPAEEDAESAAAENLAPTGEDLAAVEETN